MKNKIPWKKYLLRAAIILPLVLVLLYIGWRNTDEPRAQRHLDTLNAQQTELKLQYISAPRLFITFHYNADGHLKREESYRVTGTGHTELYTREYSYEDDVLGRKIVTIKTLDRRTGEYLDRVIVREVNRDGSCWRQEEYESGRKISEAVFDYNTKGQVRSISVWYETASMDTQSVTQYFDWNDDGRLTRYVLDNADGRTETTYIRNLRGDVIRVRWTHTAPDNTKSSGRQIYKWKYDCEATWKDGLDIIRQDGPELNFRWEENDLTHIRSQQTDPAMWPRLLNEQPWLFLHGDPSQEWTTMWMPQK